MVWRGLLICSFQLFLGDYYRTTTSYISSAIYSRYNIIIIQNPVCKASKTCAKLLTLIS